MAAASYRNALGPGTRLHWYQIEKVLGHGGFGITYLARDGNLGKFVAIKEYLPVELAVRGADLSVVPIIDRHRQHYEWGLERFLSEARTLSKFKHHNIVSVVAVFEANNTAYMVMQYEKGESLAEILRRFGTLAEAEIIRHMLPLLDGLKNVHEAGFIHRDIKPANIFTRKGGASSVLLDFGSARHALSLETRTLTNLVSAGYSPYEQYSSRSDEQGPWTDIYAAGATLYHMVAGAPPLDAIERGKGMLGSSKDILKPAVEAGRGRYSPHFLAAIDHALMFNQDDRPQTVSEWLTDFHEATGVVRYRRRPDVSRPPKTKHEDTAVQPDTVPPRAESTPPPEEWTTVSAADAGKPPLEVKGSRMWKGVAAASIVLLAGLVVWYAAWRDWQLDSDARTQVVPPSDAQIAAAQEQEAQKLLAELKAEALRLQSLREDANLLSEKLAAGRSELSEIEQKRTDEEQRLNAAQDVLERTQEESQRLKEAAARLETLRLEQLGQQATSASLQSTAMESAPGAAEEPGTEAQTDPAERQLADGIDAYERGRFDEAYSILAPLADRGKREAQLRVAAMFAAGRGVQQDYAKAASWYRNVAELGDGDAQISVAGMYESGTGVPQSNMMAYVWYSIAARSGNAEASASRDRVATRLQPAEIQQAERLIAAKLKQMGDR